MDDQVRGVGRELLLTALLWVGYVVVAISFGAGFEDALTEAAAREGTSVNQLSAEAQAVVAQDHAVYSVVTALYLALPPLVFVLTLRRVRNIAPGRLGSAAAQLGVVALVGLVAYVAVSLGLLAGPDDLPPVVRDIDRITVPTVTALAAVTLVAMALASEALHAVGVVRRSSRASTVLCLALGALSLVGLLASGASDPVPPLVVVPPALVVGIACLRRRRSKVIVGPLGPTIT